MLLFPLRYLILKGENLRGLWRQDMAATALVCVAVVLPFSAFGGNFLAPDGFLDRLGDFLSVLTGFYVAALIAVTSFASHAGLDEPIQSGKVILRQSDEDGGNIHFTRREYASAMFGYMSFVALALTMAGIFVVPLSTPAAMAIWNLLLPTGYANEIVKGIGLLAKIAFSIMIGHLLVTTARGLYYMVDRLYAKKPRIAKKPSEPRVRKTD